MSLKLESTGDIVYHISQDVTLDERTFTPRIPSLVTKDENVTTKRICFSSSLEGALSGIPYKGTIARQTLCGRPYYLSIFKTHLSEVQHLTNDEIRSEVPDAHLTEECWVTEDVTLKPEIIKVNRLKLSCYNKYTFKYSGTTTEFLYERPIAEVERKETVRLVGRHFIRRALKWAVEAGVSYEILEEGLKHLKYEKVDWRTYEDYRGTTKTYQLKEVRFTIPAGVDCSEFWLICYEQQKELHRRNLMDEAFIPRKDPEDWFLDWQDEMDEKVSQLREAV